MLQLLTNQVLQELITNQPIYLESQTLLAGDYRGGRTYLKIHDQFEVVFVMEERVYYVYPDRVLLNGFEHSRVDLHGHGYLLDVLTDVHHDKVYVQESAGENTCVEAKVGDTTCQQWYITSIENDVYTLTRGSTTHVLDAKVVPPWVFTTYGLHSEEFWTWQR